MNKWNLHIPNAKNRILKYKCRLLAGQRVRLKKEIIIKSPRGRTRKFRPACEEWIGLPGVKTDPVLWFRQADCDRHTWGDDKASVDEWFEGI
jgi:hypothetical protein